MIKLTINPKDLTNLMKEINLKVSGIEELTKPTVLQEIAKAAFTITGKRFISAVDNYSVLNPKRMHHVYEWGQIGKPNARLFVIERSRILGGNLAVSASFLPSRTSVPVPSSLQNPGRTGKSVSSRSVFRNKATVMEEGRSVTFHARKVLAFMGVDGPTFIAPGTVVHILHPGGINARNSFGNFMQEWYFKNADAIMQSSGLYEKIALDVSLALNKQKASISQVRSVVAAITDLASEGKVIIK